MKITKRQLREINKLATGKLLKEEAAALLEYEQYVDEDGNVYDDEGNVSRRGKEFGRRYGGGTYGTRGLPPQRSHSSSRRKTTSVGASANKEKIAAVEAALAAKPNNFLQSILSQLKQGRGLSSKQLSIVKKILVKTDPEGASLFEGMKKTHKRVNAMKITRRKLRRIIREAMEEASPQSRRFQNLMAWGEGYGLSPEFDNEGQLLFYLDGDSQQEAVSEAEQMGLSIEVPGAYGGYGQQDDATVIVYTDVYDANWTEEY